jgi:Raf kinase inhibitor-like YbhB/YbcL family protein
MSAIGAISTPAPRHGNGEHPPFVDFHLRFRETGDANQFVHWTVLDLKPTTTGLPRGVAPTATAIQQGRNDFGNVGYGGPCPPSGTHHYRFTLTALAAPLKLGGHPSGSAVQTALAAAKVLSRATLIGTSKA